MKTSRNLSRLAAAGLLLTVITCSDTTDEVFVPSPGGVKIAIHAGDGQAAEVGTTLPKPLAVRVTDNAGRPLRGNVVEWRVADPRDSNEGPVVATSTTDGEGVATFVLNLSSEAGVNITTALVGSSRVRFNSYGQVQGAMRMAINQGQNQLDTINATLQPLRVFVTDYRGLPVEGVKVQWSGDQVASATTSFTNSSGFAELPYTLDGRTGFRRIEANVASLLGSPVRFTVQATPGKPVSFTIVDGNDQWGKMGTALRPYMVNVADRNGNSVPNSKIDWKVVSGGGTIAPGHPSDPYGAGRVVHTLGPQPGAQTVTATASALQGQTLTFTSVAAEEVVYVRTIYDWYYGDPAQHLFWPEEITVPNGAPVTWVWECPYCPTLQLHNVTFEDDPSEPTSSPTQDKGIHTRQFTTPGTYRYRCTVHSQNFTEGMVGTVVVK